jgi:predicted  nucleic acid-binding Zn-ribbon protein
MDEKQLRFLVALQDIDNMLQESETEEELGFKTEGPDKLLAMREEVAEKIDMQMRRIYERLHEKYRRAVVPVKDDICLGCFVKLPTSLTGRGKENILIFRCENCGRILYWLD